MVLWVLFWGSFSDSLTYSNVCIQKLPKYIFLLLVARLFTSLTTDSYSLTFSVCCCFLLQYCAMP